MKNDATTRISLPMWRIFAVAIAALIILGLGIYNVAAPNRMAGYDFAAAGVSRDNHVFRTMSVLQRSGIYRARAGSVERLTIERAGRSRIVELHAQPFPDWAPGRTLDLIVEFASVVLAILVLFRARRGELSDAIVGFTVWIALDAATSDMLVTAPTSLAAFLIGDCAQTVAYGMNFYFAFRLIGLFPDGRSNVQRFSLRFAPFAGGVAFLSLASNWIWVLAPRYSSPILSILSVGAYGVFALIGFGVLLWVALHVKPQDRARTRWFASSLLLFEFLATFAGTVYALFPRFPAAPTGAAMVFYLTNLGPIGPIYATLRHRIIDLDVVISRSAIYGALSVFVVGLFIGAEWLAGRISDAFVSESHRGTTTQIVSFAVALAVGLSVRHVHEVLEKRINGIFFRNRTRRLESLERFAYEADMSDNREGLLNLTFQTLTHSIETPSVALYVADGAGFGLARSSDPSAPERLDKNDRLVLRLLRWPQAFQFEDPGELHGWLIVPLMVRTNVLGFMACAPKADHTRYLPDELSALNTLAHHVATSYAFISSENAFRIDALKISPA